MIPRNEGEELYAYLQRLEVIAFDRDDILSALERLTAQLATATLAHDQLARYTALITADMAGQVRFVPNSENNGAANSGQLDHVAQEPDHAAQVETLSSTPENAPAISLPESANSENNSETAAHVAEDAGQQPVPKTSIAELAVALLRDGTSRTAREIAAAIGREYGTTQSRLSKMRVAGRLTVTGNYPSLYSLPDSSALAEPAETADSQPPPLDAGTDEIEAPEDEEGAAPVYLDRSRLPVDQRLLLEHLEKQGAMTPRLAAAQLNWANSRIDRASGALLQGGLLGWRGNTLVVTPDELLIDQISAD